MSEDNPKPGQTWGLLELMGHQRMAGALSEFSFGGTFVRVDVPETPSSPAFTKLFGPNAIFGITFTSEEVARQLAAKLSIKPVQPWELNLGTKSAQQYVIEAMDGDTELDEEYFNQYP